MYRTLRSRPQIRNGLACSPRPSQSLAVVAAGVTPAWFLFPKQVRLADSIPSIPSPGGWLCPGDKPEVRCGGSDPTRAVSQLGPLGL